MDMMSPGTVLLKQLRSTYPIPTGLMVDAVAALEADMRRASEGQPIPLSEWIGWIKKDRAHRDAIMRVLFLIVAVRGMTVQEVDALRRDLQSTSTLRRRKPQPIREPGERLSPRLY